MASDRLSLRFYSLFSWCFLSAFVSDMAEKRNQINNLLLRIFDSSQAHQAFYFLDDYSSSPGANVWRFILFFDLSSKPSSIHNRLYLWIISRLLMFKKKKKYNLPAFILNQSVLALWFYVDPFAFVWTSVCSCLLPWEWCVNLLFDHFS